MKVLVVIDALSFGGAENVLVTLAAQAPRLGLSLDVVSLAPPTRGRSDWLPRLRATGHEPRFLGIERLTQPGAVPALVAAIRSSGCDVVHAHLETAATLVPVAARLARTPALCTLHHVPVPLQGRDAARERLAVALGSRSQGLLLVSQASLDGFAARFPRSRRHGRWTVVHNGVDLERYRPSDPVRPTLLPSEINVPQGVPVVTLVGHMRPGKGQEVAVRAWPAVLSHVPDARLLLVGDGPQEPALRALVQELRLDGRIVFAGARQDVDALLPASTLVVLPTRMEALPTVLLEASASGVPSVATAVGGVPEVVVDGETGWLVPQPSAELFAATLSRALTDPAALHARGAAARQRAEQLFDARDWAARLAAEYQLVAGTVSAR